VGARLAAVGKQLDLCPKAEMREIRTSGLKSGIWKRRHGQIFRHRHPERVGKQFMAAPNPTAPDLDLQLKSRHSCSSSSFLLENLAVWSNEPTAQNNCERVSLLSRRKSWVFEDDHEDEDENDFQTSDSGFNWSIAGQDKSRKKEFTLFCLDLKSHFSSEPLLSISSDAAPQITKNLKSSFL
jgi:hypothetical protein